MLKLKLQNFGQLMGRTDSLEKTDAGKDWRQEEKGTTEGEMVGWHHRLNGHTFEQAPGDSEGQGSLAYCSPWGHKKSDRTQWLNNSNRKKWNKNKCGASQKGSGWKHKETQKMCTYCVLQVVVHKLNTLNLNYIGKTGMAGDWNVNIDRFRLQWYVDFVLKTMGNIYMIRWLKDEWRVIFGSSVNSL